jgi:hypothetical protein
MACDGKEWRSPVFDIGSAKPSQIPAPKKITRKSPHQNTRATINDRPGTATHGRGLDTDNQQPSTSGYGSSKYGSSNDRGSNPSYGSSNDRESNTGFSSNTDSGFGQSRNGGYIPSGSLNSNGYQARQSTATDSLATAVDDQNEFEGTHVGKYNVTGSQLPQDPISMPNSGVKNTYVAAQDPSRNV